jgi:hypothetical protein
MRLHGSTERSSGSGAGSRIALCTRLRRQRPGERDHRGSPTLVELRAGARTRPSAHSVGSSETSSILKRRRARGLAFDAVLVVLALALLSAGALDARSGQVAVGTVEIVVAICVGLIFGTSLFRRFRPKELGLLDALGAAGVFAVFGLLGLSATLSGDAVRTTFGAVAAAILLPASALIVISVLRSRRDIRAVQDR